jgi:hypothetical protein
MKRHMWIAALVVALIGAVAAPGAGPPCHEPPREGFLKRLAPAGGWHPDGGGLLHWWPRHCFPRCGGPDDYCRKPLPHVCWPPYPPCYTWGPPEICHPQGSCRPAHGKSQ